MPAPTQAQIYQNLKASLLTAGYTKKSYDSNGNLITDPLNLMPELDKLINTLSNGISITWTEWQALQTVASPVQVVPATGTGATVPTPGSLP